MVATAGSCCRGERTAATYALCRGERVVSYYALAMNSVVLLAQPIDVVDDGLPERRGQRVPIAEHDAIDQVEMQKLERDTRPTAVRLNEQVRSQVVLSERSRDIRSQPALAAWVAQRD